MGKSQTSFSFDADTLRRLDDLTRELTRLEGQHVSRGQTARRVLRNANTGELFQFAKDGAKRPLGGRVVRTVMLAPRDIEILDAATDGNTRRRSAVLRDAILQADAWALVGVCDA